MLTARRMRERQAEEAAGLPEPPPPPPPPVPASEHERIVRNLQTEFAQRLAEAGGREELARLQGELANAQAKVEELTKQLEQATAPKDEEPSGEAPPPATNEGGEASSSTPAEGTGANRPKGSGKGGKSAPR